MTVFSPSPKNPPKPPRSRRPLKKSGRPKAVNRKRKARLFREDFGGKAYLEYIHSLPCAICEVYGWTEAAHVKSRGAGGKVDDVAPLCGNRFTIKPTPYGSGMFAVTGCHTLLDAHDKQVEEHRLRLRTLAKKLYQEFQSRTTNKEN